MASAGTALSRVLHLLTSPIGGQVRCARSVSQWTARTARTPRSAFWSRAAGRPARLAQERGIPIGRIADAEELAALVLFLASARAAYISGTAINFDGGASPVW